MSRSENTDSSLLRRRKCRSFKVISYIVEILKEHYAGTVGTGTSTYENRSSDTRSKNGHGNKRGSSKEVSSSVSSLGTMTQFSSPGQIVGLFTVATIVSIGLIFLINAEVASRADHLETRSSGQQIGGGLSGELEDREPVIAFVQHNYPRQVQAPQVQVQAQLAGEGAGVQVPHVPGNENEFDSSRIPNHNNVKKPQQQTTTRTTTITERTNFLTYFGSQIIKLFTSVNSNINLAHLGKFEDDEHQVGAATVSATSIESGRSASHVHEPVDSSPTFESHRMKRGAGARESPEQRMVSSTFSAGGGSNVMDGNNNNVKNENLGSTFNGGGGGGGSGNNNNVRNMKQNVDVNVNSNGRNYGSVIGSFSGGSSGAKVPGPGSSVTSDFHKIRHAMKKLENDGGLEGDVVLRMMLGPNAKIVEARQPPQHHQQNQNLPPLPPPPAPAVITHITTTATAAPSTARPAPTQQSATVGADEDNIFINYKEKLTSFQNKNTIDWKSYADEDEIDENDDDDDDDDDDEADDNEDEGVGVVGKGQAAAEIDGARTRAPVMNWPDETRSSSSSSSSNSNSRSRTAAAAAAPAANEDEKDPSSSFIYRAVVPGERKHSRNYYTDGGEHYGHGPNSKLSSTNSNSNSVKIVKVSVPNSISVDDLNNINNSNEDERVDEGDESVFLDPTTRILNASTGDGSHQQVGSSVSNANVTAGLAHGGHATKKSIIKQGIDNICYKTDDVLIVIAITCCLNFAFVLIIWTSVKWFSLATGNGSKEKQFQPLECEGEDGLSEPVVDFHNTTIHGRADPDDPFVYWPPVVDVPNYHGGKSHGHAGRPRPRTSSTRRKLSHNSQTQSQPHSHNQYYYSRGMGTCGYDTGTGSTVHRRTMGTTSMYSFRPADSCGSNGNAAAMMRSASVSLQNQQLRRSYSYSMEDLRFYNCS